MMETDKIALRDQLIEQLQSLNPDAYDEISGYLADDDYDTQINTLREVIANERAKRTAPIKTEPHVYLPQTKHTMSGNPFLNDDDFEDYTPSNRKGMRDLQRVVLDNQRDIRRVRKALDRNYCDELITKHNKRVKRAKSKWHPHYDDVNGDNIPDFIIHNGGVVPSNPNALECNGEPIIVNGWTTKKSDYPTRRLYYDTVPEDQRKDNPLSEWKRNKKLWGIQYKTMDDTDDPNEIGELKAWTKDAIPKEWRLDGWATRKYTEQEPPKRANPYYTFCTLFVKLYVEQAADNLITAGVIPVVTTYDAKTGERKVSWPRKVVDTARVNAKLYDDLIIRKVLYDYVEVKGYDFGINVTECKPEAIQKMFATKAGKKLKKSSEFQYALRTEVAHFGAALLKEYSGYRTLDKKIENWTAEDRARLKHEVRERAERYFAEIYIEPAQVEEAVAAGEAVEAQREQEEGN